MANPEILNKQDLETSKEFMPIEEIKDHILSNYNIDIINIENVKFKDTDKQRAVYKVETNKGYKCLKKVYYSEGNLLFIYSVIEWINARGILAPRLISTKKGLKYVKYNNHLFILTDWIEGRKCNYDNIEDVEMASSNLAKIHQCSKNFWPIEGSEIQNAGRDFYQSNGKHFNQLLESSNNAFMVRDRFSKLFLGHFEHNINVAQKSVELLLDIDFSTNIGDDVSSHSICHLDYVNKNLIITPENKIWVIDFDRCRMSYPVHDISSYLKRIMKRKKTLWDFSLFETAIRNYESVRKLSLNEHIIILSLLMFPQKYWKISRDYYKNRDKCNKNAFYSILKKVTDQDDAHNEFCIKYKEYIDERFKLK